MIDTMLAFPRVHLDEAVLIVSLIPVLLSFSHLLPHQRYIYVPFQDLSALVSYNFAKIFNGAESAATVVICGTNTRSSTTR